MTPSESDEIAVLKARIRDYETVLNQNNLHLAITFGLTPSISNILGLLLALPVVTPKAIQHDLEIATDPKVAIYKLRTILNPWHTRLGLGEKDLLIHGRRLVGYWLEPAVKEKIRAAVSARIGVTAEVTI
jgi:hypothetical protein